MADDRGKKGGGGGGGGEKKSEDSPFENAASLVIERLARMLGENASTLLPDKLRDEVKRMARGKNLGTAIFALGRAAEIFEGNDEEVRGAIRGFTDGLSRSFMTIEGDPKDLPQRVTEALDKDTRLAEIGALERAGRLKPSRQMPFGEAVTYLNPDQRKAISGVLPFLGDALGAFLDTKFTAREMQGIAEIICASGGPSKETAAMVKKRFSPPPSAVKNAANQLEELLAIARKHLETVDKRPGAVPFAMAARAETARIASGRENVQDVMARLRGAPAAPLPTPSAPASPPGRFRRWVIELLGGAALPATPPAPPAPSPPPPAGAGGGGPGGGTP